ncbi:MAG: ABC transporter ATP-binding protein [Elusimicrobia bacterium]|nr:ABC transporter ATP-binding protein [Elusimicrobiota bacterium]
MDAALSYLNVTKVYSRSHLGRRYDTLGLSELTLEVRAGEILGLLGLNGSGKTTSIKLALGLLTPSLGEVRIFGKRPQEDGTLKDVGFLPELPYFYPNLSPAEALRFYGRLSGLRGGDLEKQIGVVLERVGLEPQRKKKLGEFSKGMLQKLGLAQAVLHRPKILFLDEPVSGLDPVAIRDIRELLSQLSREGCTLFLSSHSISEVERLCHRVAILVRGRLARLVESAEWEKAPGRLEQIFIETVAK